MLAAQRNSYEFIAVWTQPHCLRLRFHPRDTVRMWVLQLLSAGGDGLLKLWNVRTTECVNTFDEHEGKVRLRPAACCANRKPRCTLSSVPPR